LADTTKSFWQTAPGVITAVAALITALGGVLGLLVQNDVIGAKSGDRASETAAVATPVGEASDQGPSGAAPTESGRTASLVPWLRASAALVRRDETSAIVKASTVGMACDTQQLAFQDGQRIGLELVRRIQFVAIYSETASADAVVTLLDGRQLKNAVLTRNCPITGRNELGSVNVNLADIKRIDFRR
jgi:hypothetical protein